jgi:adenosine kinase
MNHAHLNQVSDAPGCTLGMVSPDGRRGMIEHAAQFAQAGIPFIFDPGQGLPMFGADELICFIEQAHWLACNDYEAKLLEERTGKSPQQLTQMLEAVIVTRGGEGSCIHTRDKTYTIPAAPVDRVVDPTGCGDAYRAGLLYGLLQGMDWEVTGRIAALMGAIKVEQAGTQNHDFTADRFEQRFQQAFGYSFT